METMVASMIARRALRLSEIAEIEAKPLTRLGKIVLANKWAEVEALSRMIADRTE